MNPNRTTIIEKRAINSWINMVSNWLFNHKSTFTHSLMVHSLCLSTSYRFLGQFFLLLYVWHFSFACLARNFLVAIICTYCLMFSPSFKQPDVGWICELATFSWISNKQPFYLFLSSFSLDLISFFLVRFDFIAEIYVLRRPFISRKMDRLN